METLPFPLENPKIQLKYSLGDVVIYTHPDYSLKLLGRVINLLSHEDTPAQTLENSFALIHQMDWIGQQQFKSLDRLDVPGVMEFLDTNRAVEIPLSNIIRHFPVFEILAPDDYGKGFIKKAFNKHEMQYNPIVVRRFNICNWDPTEFSKKRFMNNYPDDDIVPCCDPQLTICWANRDLESSDDDFYNLFLPNIITPLIRSDLRGHPIPFIWEQIVSNNPNGLIMVNERNKRVKSRLVPGRVEALIHEKAYSFLCDVVKDIKELSDQDAPAAVVSLYLKFQSEQNLPEFIDMIDNEFDSLDVPEIKEQDEEELEEDEEMDEISVGESVSSGPVSKKAKPSDDDEDDPGDVCDDSEEEDDDEDSWDSEDDTNPSIASDDLPLHDDDDEELEQFI